MHELKQQWQGLREAQPGLRIRDAASRLGVPEAALLETRIGDGVARLAPDIRAVCHALPGLGMVMSLVRNEAAVHEKDIAFVPAAAAAGDAIRFAGGDFFLEVDPAVIAHAFHVEDAGPKGRLRSLQLFDAEGIAAWKIYARDKADHAAFERLVNGLARKGDAAGASFARPASPGASAAALPAADAAHLQTVLERTAEHGLPLSLEVSNRGVCQRHRGPVHRIARMGSWLNVLDPGFDWHLDESCLAAASRQEQANGSRLTLWQPGGGEAAVLALDDRAADGQKAIWNDILEQARQND